ncbi:alpha/beta hydrolase-fold protein [Peristeroidobacter soli]|uniref:alpha/beta hydrolase-fold protein n=1 Tax=Peristeroidobacter soli TaxID=2497877 RepID=UPI00101C956B|nr:alpha/beta hydrolase-fold protein [Peristeroidobacter soli]
MMRAFIASVLSLLAVLAQAAESPRMQRLEQSLKAEGAKATDAFWREIDAAGTPLIERMPGRVDRMWVTFLWRQTAQRDATEVGVVGIFNQTPWQSNDVLTRLANSDVWYRTYELETDARAPYAFSWPEGRVTDEKPLRKEWRVGGMREIFRDPRARHEIPEVFFARETPVDEDYFEGPDAKPERWLKARAGVPRGTVSEREITSRILNNTREVAIYTPPGHSKDNGPYAFVVLFDGLSYLYSAAIPTQLDNMRADGVLPPVVAIMVDYIDAAHRQCELTGEPEFGRFIAEELVPDLREELHLTRDPRKAVVAGASRGGLAASYIAVRHPRTFGNVLAQSGSFSWAPKGEPDGALLRELAEQPALPVRFHVVAGTWETPDRMLRYSRALRDLLENKRYQVSYGEYPGGHTFLNWRATLPDGLIALMRP